MTLRLVDDEGPIEIDGEILMALLRESFLLGAGATAQMFTKNDRKRMKRAINVVFKVTWQQKGWPDRFVGHVFDFARKYRKEDRNNAYGSNGKDTDSQANNDSQ